MGVLGQLIPERMTGDVRGTSNHTYIGNKRFIFYEYPSGGTGASARGDGSHAVRAFNEGENVSIQSTEVIEANFPIRILQNELRPDSGGPGLHRGGCGLIRRVQVLCDDALFSLLSDRNIVAPAGVNGGHPGAANRYRVLRNDQAVAFTPFPGKVAGFPLQRGDVVVMESSGGGGWGGPSGRRQDALQEDLRDELVSLEGLQAYRSEPVTLSAAVDPSLTRPHHCLLSTEAAHRLGAQVRSLIELQHTSGPAYRFWVIGIRPELAGVDIAVATPVPASRLVARLLAAQTPLTC
jgi:N-methylhydantoinase B